VAVVDTNCDPSEVDYVIPGNDDALRAIRLFASKISDSVAEGAQLMTDKQAADLAAAVYAQPEAAPVGEAGGEAPSEAAGDAGTEDISMEEVLGSTVRKQPAAAKETVDEDVPQVETQTY
jgi:small subunit ribosomal protein S2